MSAARDYKYLKYEELLSGQASLGWDRQVGITLIGLGRIGIIHLINLLKTPRAKLLYCVDSNPQRLEDVRERLLPSSVRCRDGKDLNVVLEDPEVQAVIICSPTSTHQNIVLSAIEAGKAVFCEKPLAHSVADTELCYQKAKEAGVPLLCAFNRRFDPDFSEIRQRAWDGDLGRISVVRTCSRDSPRPSIEYLKISGGIFHDCAVHDIDLVCRVLRELPVSCHAQASSLHDPIREIGDFDEVLITLKFLSGAQASIELGRYSPVGYIQRLEVAGEKGELSSQGRRSTNVAFHGVQGTSTAPIHFSFASRYEESYIAEMEHFLDNIDKPDELEVKGWQTISVIKIADACEKSAKTGQVIHLTWED